MNSLIKVSLASGAIILVIGILGTFMQISQNDGALTISGSVIFAAGVIANVLNNHKK